MTTNSAQSHASLSQRTSIPDGRWWGRSEIHIEWEVVAIERKSQPKNPRTDKDAAWLLKQADDMSYTATKTVVRRLRAIAKRLNGGVAP